MLFTYTYLLHFLFTFQLVADFLFLALDSIMALISMFDRMTLKDFVCASPQLFLWTLWIVFNLLQARALSMLIDFADAVSFFLFHIFQ